jgi:hypothetical protein
MSVVVVQGFHVILVGVALLAACGGKVTSAEEGSPSTGGVATSGSDRTGGTGGSTGASGGMNSTAGGVVTSAAGGTLPVGTGGGGSPPIGGASGSVGEGGSSGEAGAAQGGTAATWPDGAGGVVLAGGADGHAGAGGVLVAGGADGHAGASEVSGASGAAGDAGTEVVCTESTTQCAVADKDPNAVINGTCYERECSGYFYSSSYSSFQSGPPCPTDLEQAVGSACEPEGTECFWGSHQYGCTLVDSSLCYSDSCEVYPDGLEHCQPACKAYSNVPSWYVCVPGGLCQDCFGGGCGTDVLCSGGLWQLVRDSCSI